MSQASDPMTSREVLRKLEGDCIRLSEELDDAREANIELAKYARDANHWEAVADRMRNEICRLTGEREHLRDLLRNENERADNAIRREEVADEHAEELAVRIVDLEDEIGESVDGMCTGMHADVAEAHSAWEDVCKERDRYRAAWQSARWRARHKAWRLDFYRRVVDVAQKIASVRRHERDRYRLAWLSARRRAADEANFGMEALELRDAEIARLKAQLAAERKSTSATPN